MPNCDNCSDKCPKAELAHSAALGRMYATNEFVNLQKKIESGQFVEVVRCKDCKKGHPELSLCDDATWCVKFGRNMDLDGFCCMGEMRNNERKSDYD